jgi:hypothetical protein
LKENAYSGWAMIENQYQQGENDVAPTGLTFLSNSLFLPYCRSYTAFSKSDIVAPLW